MNFYTRAIDKFVKKVGEHNLPYVYMVIFILFMIGMAMTVNHGIQRMDDHYERQFQVFENNLKELDNISKDLNEIHQNTRQIHTNMIEIKERAESLRRQAKQLEEELNNAKSR